MKKSQENTSSLLIQRIICYVVLVFITILCLFSFYILFINSTRNHAAIQSGFSFLPGKSFLNNIKNLMSDPYLPVLTGIRNSLIVAAACAVVCPYFSAMTAYAIHCYDFKIKKAAFTFILMIMMVPAQVSALGFVRLMRSFHMVDTYWPLIIPTIAAPITFFFMKQYMDSALPLEIVEAARIDGSNEFRTFNSVVMPILKPAFSVQAIFTFTGTWNNYFMPSLLINKMQLKTLPILIAQLRSADFMKFDIAKVYMLIFFAIFPVIIVYLFLSKNIVQGVALGAVKG